MPHEINLGTMTDMLGVELRIAQILADRVFSGSSAAKLAPGHFTVLSLIKLNPGINQSSLARCMHLDRSSMVPILDQLQEKAWLERRRNATDRRAYSLHLTRKGSRMLDNSERQVIALESRISEAMGPNNRDKLLQLIQQLQVSLKGIESDQ